MTPVEPLPAVESTSIDQPKRSRASLLPIVAGSLLLLFLALIGLLVVLNIQQPENTPATPAMNITAAALVVTTVLLVATPIVGTRILGGRTQVPAYLRKNGWKLQLEPQLADRILHDFTFDEIHGMSENRHNTPELRTGGKQPAKTVGGQNVRWRGISEVMTGQVRGREALSFKNDYIYNEGGFPGQTLPRPEFVGVKIVMRHAGIVALKAQSVIPYMHLVPNIPAYTIPSLKVESHDFNQRWMIHTDRHDARYAHALLTPTLIELLVSEDVQVAGNVIFHQGWVISVVPVADHTVETVDARLQFLAAVADRIPAFVADAFAYAHVDPSAPGWTQPRQ